MRTNQRCAATPARVKDQPGCAALADRSPEFSWLSDGRDQVLRHFAKRLEDHRILELADIGLALRENATAPVLALSAAIPWARRTAALACGHSTAWPLRKALEPLRGGTRPPRARTTIAFGSLTPEARSRPRQNAKGDTVGV
jgi:hypothetical protein